MRSQPNDQDGIESYTQYIQNLNMASYSKPPLCGVIYIYCKVSLLAVKNQEEVERSVRDYVMLIQQQQAPDDEIYEGYSIY